MIQLVNISIAFHNVSILRNVNMDIHRGDLIHITGSNGPGKSTLLKIIAGLLNADKGEVIIENNDIEIGALIENPAFIENESAEYNLKFLYDLKNSYDRKTVQSYMEYFDLTLEDKRAVKKYSVGMRQKLGIIQAIMENQNIILFDEPTRGLDNTSSNKFIELVKKLNSDKKTIIICAHDGVDEIPFNRKFTIDKEQLYECID